MKGQQSWVTFASDDDEGIKALILARSLRNVITRRLLTIFVSFRVSEELRVLLEERFDRCIILDKKQLNEYHGLQFSTVAKINSWNLSHLRKFVFLDCNSVVLINSDEIFKQQGFSLIRDEVNDPVMLADTTSKSKFIESFDVMKSFSKTDGVDHFSKVFNKGCSLDTKYNFPIDLLGENLEINLSEMKIIRLSKVHPIEFLSDKKTTNSLNLGIIEQAVIDKTVELFKSEATYLFKSIPEFLKEILNGNNNGSVNLNTLKEVDDSVAIVGLSFRLPGANNLDEFWDLLINGKEGIIPVPEGRWEQDVRTQCIEKSKQAGFLNCPIDEIDAKFFGLSPMEVSFTDPQQRLTLQVIWEALEHAGINPNSLKNSKTGVFGGWWRNDYKEELQQNGIIEQDFFRTYMGNSLGTLTGRISHVLELTGPSVPTESACSTSMVAVDMACKSLLNEDCDVGLAFGVNLLLRPFGPEILKSVIAPDGRCKTFDAKADGFGRAEGCTVLVLKRYSDAIRDGDRVWGLIRGSAVVQEGPSRSLGTPTVQCEALAMQLALEDAGVEAKDVSFVETHGTGTAVGDPMEVAAITKIYSSKERQNKLVIGSVKTNIGHTESCSGISGIIKTLLALEHNAIPPHRNFDTLNPEINLEKIPAIIPMTPYKWQTSSNGKPRLAGVSSFGITGTDAHVIIQETPELRVHSGLKLYSEMPLHLLKISAKSPEALKDLQIKYKTFLEKTTENLTDICYTASTGRGDFSHRSVILGSDKREMIKNLEKTSSDLSVQAPKLCFLFTGQGSQYPGMAKALYDHSPVFQMHFDNSDKILSRVLGISIKNALWGDKTQELGLTIYSQTSIFCIEYCLLKLWESWGIKPDFVLGHSLGEFAAAVAAGILKFSDALTLVAERSRLINNLPTGKMLVVKECQEKVDVLLKAAFSETTGDLDYAAINSEDQTVLAGSEENVLKFAELLRNNDIKTMVLQSTHAFHSRQMEPMLEEYRKTASTIKYGLPKCTFISGMDGAVKEAGEVEADYWVRHTREPVRFTKASKSILEIGETISFLEIGPQPILSALILSNADTLGTRQPLSCLPSMRKNDDNWSTILNTLGNLYKQGVEINWKNFHQFSGGRVVTIPFYSFQNKKFSSDVNKSNKQKPIHPLVGAPVPNASELKIFQNELSVLKTLYLKDHVIGNTIIMPGAGFMEMCLVAGQAAFQGYEGGYIFPASSVTIQDFIIEGPLALHDSETTLVQSVVTTDDTTGDTRVAIYSKLVLDKETHKWIRHASGIFCPYGVQEQKMTDTLGQIKSRCSEQLTTHNSYDKFSEFGLKFGPTFRNLVTGHQGINDVYFQICQPSEMSTDDYILHPVILDAMFQAVAIISHSDTNQLHVPISITKLIWHAKLTTQTSYVHLCKKSSLDEEEVATLYDENGLRVVTMFGATLIPTNVNTVMSAIEGQKTSLPSIYQEVWRDQLGPWERRVPNLSIYYELYLDRFKSHDDLLSQDEEDYYDNANKLCSLYIIRVFSELGWNFKLGQESSLNALIATLAISRSFKRFTRYMLTLLVEDGYLKETSLEDNNDFGFKVLRNFPPGEALSSEIEKLFLTLNPSLNVASVSVRTVADKLCQILSGKLSALPILFPEDPNDFQPLEEYYKNCDAFQHCFEVITEVCTEPMEILASSLPNSKAVLRILEVGAGTGSLTNQVLKQITGPASGYEYTYTDISPVFFSSGEQIFKDSEIRVVYKTLNIETDPTLQGFIPHYYDIIYASFVVHATKNIRISLVNLRNLLRPGGALLLTELTKPLREINLTVGVLEGFWVFEDYDLRPSNCEMSGEKWKKVLRSSGFNCTTVFPVYNDHTALIISTASDNSLGYINHHLSVKTTSKTWVVFSNHNDSTKIIEAKLSQIGRHVVLVNSSESEQHLSTSTHYTLNLNRQSQPLLEMQNLFKDLFANSKTTLLLEGVIYIANQDTRNEDETELNCNEYFYLCQTLVGMNNIKLFVLTRGTLSLDDHNEVTSPFPGSLIGMTKGLQNENTTLICRNIDMDPSSSLLAAIDDAFTELFVQDCECVVAYRRNQRKVSRFIPQKTMNNSLKFPTDRSRLILPTSNAIQDLRFGPDITYELGKSDIEIQVRSFSLNFRDVLVVLKPTSQFDDFNSVGLDFSGVVTAVGSEVSLHKIGDFVVGINLYERALPSHIVTNERLVMPMQEAMTFNEAATLPVVSLTIYMCFFEGNKLKKNDIILIHTGSGGVGLYAIQVAKILNCTIIATAGNTRKRNYLRSLGVKHVFNSRNTEYGTQIREALGGKGVDFVLNSLTGVGFKEATLSVCNSGAKFIEISKLNVWTPEEVKVLRPDVYYEIVDASVVPILQAVEYMKEMNKIDPSVNKPLPYVRFDAADIREALNYLQKAKHIGKIICVMPESIGLKGSHEMIMPLFNDKSSYLITGGLGGIGIEIAKWMVQRGAKDIILVGRNAPNKKAAEEIEIMRSGCNKIHVKQCDVSDFSQCQSLLESLKDSGLPTLRGIMHAAGVLSDGTYENQTWGKYEQVFNPKIKGGWNLHLLTLDYSLEHFVMFSSAAGVFGGLGQSNHAAANMFLDCLAHYRNYMGLPASTINWGQWGQVGVAANIEIIGIKPMSTLQCVSALEKLMKMNSLQSCVCEADFSIIKKIFQTSRIQLSEFQETQSTNCGNKLNPEEFWAEYDNSNDTEGQIQVIKKYIRSVIQTILKIDENESLDEQEHFQNIGMDSLMMIELKNGVQSIVGDRAKITMNSVKDCSTIAQLATRIVELISGTKELPPLTREELNQLIREDATLPSHIKPANSNVACKPSQIRTVFITGVSGNLGPYILQEILKRPHIEKIYCLMRGSVKESAETRLRTILSEKKMDYSSLIECVDGNVIQSKFGIENKVYVKLAEEVDAIFHVAVKASLQELYQKLPDSDRDIRTVNVLGTKNVLEFSCAGKTKIVYHTSSLVAISKLDEDKRMSEDWPKIDECDLLPDDAYIISKFIGDILIAQAVERKVPCKAFRFPFIGGDSKTGGNISVLNNSLLLRMMSYMHLGVMPAVSFPFMILPVDVCAELSCRIFFNDKTGWEAYNIHNPRVNDEQDLKDIVQELGYKVDLVRPEEFVEIVKLKDNTELLLMIKKGVENWNQVLKVAEGSIFPLAEAWVTRNKTAFLSKKLEKLIPEYPECMETGLDILKRDLLHAKNSGMFEKLGV